MISVKRISVIGDSSVNQNEENWLVFERNVAHIVDDKQLLLSSDRLAVQIAFQVSDYEQDGRPNIVQTEESYLNVLFATEKETHFGFLVQGPFITTPARDSISQDNPFNIALAEETGELIIEALRWLRDRDWLTVKVLQTLPLAYKKTENGFEREVNPHRWTLFEPIYDKVTRTMMDESLIPAHEGGYVPAKDARIAGSVALRGLLDSSQLHQLFDFGELTQWMTAEITEERTQDLWRYLTTILDVEEIDAEKFVRRINVEFMMDQSDDWIRQFYEFASGFNNRSYFQSSPFNMLRQQPIIRLENCSHVAPYRHYWDDKPKAYLPTEHESRFPTVKREVCNSVKSHEFLKKLGLSEPDVVDEVLTHILPKYGSKQEIDDSELGEDIELIVQAVREVDSIERKNALVSTLKDTSFLLAENALGKREFRKPGDKPGDIIYFRNQTLEMYFEGNPNGWLLSMQYEQYLDDLRQLGIRRGVKWWLRESNDSGYVKLQTPYKGSESYPHKRGLDGFDSAFKIDGLEFALSNPAPERSCYIWNTLLLPRKHSIVGTVESSPVQSFPSHRTSVESNVLSYVGRLGREKAWLPDGNGAFVKPSEISLSDLPDSFRNDSDLASALGMRASETSISDLLERDDIADDVKQRLEYVNELSVEDLELMKKYPDVLEQLRQKDRETVETLDPDEYPSELEGAFNRHDNHTDRRPYPRDPMDHLDTPDLAPEDRLNADIDSEPDPEERYELNVRRTWQARNPETRKFLEMEYEGRCQICDYTFEQKNKTYYFEAVHLISRISAQWADDPRNAVCLCANHSAQFLHGEHGTPVSEIIEQIALSTEGHGNHVSIMLCGEPQLVGFSEKHLTELRALLGGIDNL